MPKFKQGMAAVMLVMSLGLVVPSLFTGSVSADPKPGSGKTEDPRTFYCDINGDGEYEKSYEVVSQGNGWAGFHDIHSSTVLVYVKDVTVEQNQQFNPDSGALIGDPVYSTNVRKTNKGTKVGQNAQIVACREGSPDPNLFTYVTDITACCDPLIKDAHYHVYESRTWYVTVSGEGAVNAAHADNGKHHADRAHKATNGGKHRSRGKDHS